MEIKIGVGLDNIKFGMKQEDVKELLGAPDQIRELDEELENKIIYYYNDSMIKLKFDKDENFKLYSIEVANQDVTLFNKKTIGLKKDKILKMLEDNNVTNFERNDYTSFDTLFCEEIWTTFEFEYGKVRSVEFSPLFKDENVIIWPE